MSQKHYVAPWYLAYLILALITSGMLPFLLPLMAATVGLDLGRIAYVIGAYNVGMLPAPLLGALAERHQLFRPVFFGGLILLSVSLSAATEAATLTTWLSLALLCGLGAGAVATVAPLFVLNFAPKSEWDRRIGWLQSFGGGGQVVGLLIAGMFVGSSLAFGFWFCAALSALAIVVGHLGLPSKGHPHEMRLPPLAWSQLMGRFHYGPPLGGVLHQSHHLQGEGVRRLRKSLSGEFGRFLTAWTAIEFGVAPFFAYYPLMMNDSYGIAPRMTALLYAVIAAVGIGLFVIAGRAGQRYGSRLVFQLGLAVRMAGFGILAALTLTAPPGVAALAIVGFTLVTLAWPVLSVSGTGLAARLTPIGEGAAMGLLEASGAMATLLGIILAGPLVDALGYQVVPPIAIVGLLVAVVLTGTVKRATRRLAADNGTSGSVVLAPTAAPQGSRPSKAPGITPGGQ